MKILLIEDDLIWQIKIKEILYMIQADYKVDVSSNIEDSLLYLKSTIPDLIISDVILEDNLVFDLFDHTEYKNIPFIFMTISENEEFYLKSKDIINALYLVKPFKLLSLKSAMDTLMQNQSRKLGKSPQGIPVRGKNNERIVLKPVDIIIESESNYCILKTRKNRFVIKASLKKIYEDLGYEVIQIHKKYLVNTSYISKLNLPKMEVFTEIGVYPIGRKYKPNLFEYLNEKREL